MHWIANVVKMEGVIWNVGEKKDCYMASVVLIVKKGSCRFVDHVIPLTNLSLSLSAEDFTHLSPYKAMAWPLLLGFKVERPNLLPHPP